MLALAKEVTCTQDRARKEYMSKSKASKSKRNRQSDLACRYIFARERNQEIYTYVYVTIWDFVDMAVEERKYFIWDNSVSTCTLR